MEVNGDLGNVFGGLLVRLDGQRLKQLGNTLAFEAIDKMGELSATAAQLKAPVTKCEKLMATPENTLYLMWEKDPENEECSFILGILKVGRKSLFLFDKEMKSYQGKVLCVFDFYIHFSRHAQRDDIGKQLFDFMLENEQVEPVALALDNPSVQLMAFMSKHYNLNDPIWQSTNFVVFKEFFTTAEKEKHMAAYRYLSLDKDTGKSPLAEWTRDGTPYQVGAGSNGPVSKVGDLSTEGTFGHKRQAAKDRKAHILSSKPLW